MNHAVVAFDVTQGLPAQPVQQFIAVRRLENGLQGVILAPRLGAAFRNHQQVKVVVAEDGQRRVAEALDEAQRFQRFRPAIDQIADQPQAIARRAESAFVQQPLQGIETALNIADGVGGHELLRSVRMVD